MSFPAFLIAVRQRSVVMSSVMVITPRMGLIGTMSMPTMRLCSGMYLWATCKQKPHSQN